MHSSTGRPPDPTAEDDVIGLSRGLASSTLKKRLAKGLAVKSPGGKKVKMLDVFVTVTARGRPSTTIDLAPRPG